MAAVGREQQDRLWQWLWVWLRRRTMEVPLKSSAAGESCRFRMNGAAVTPHSSAHGESDDGFISVRTWWRQRAKGKGHSGRVDEPGWGGHTHSLKACKLASRCKCTDCVHSFARARVHTTDGGLQ